MTQPPLRLHFNENTAGCSPAVIRALAALDVTEISHYETDVATTAAIAGWFGVDPSWVLPANGLDEGILLASQLALVDTRADYEGIIVEPAFEEYAAAVTAMCGDVVRVMPAPEFAFDPQRVLAHATTRTRVVYLCDPNNPTGLGLARSDVETLADALPNAAIFVDEAYADFSGRTLIGPGLVDRPNLIVGRTFAKGHGLAALRIGALIAAPATIARVRKLALPFRINIAAAVGLRAAFADRAHLDQTVADARASKAMLTEMCGRLGLATWPSAANFQLIRVGAGAADCVAWMEGRGVRIRDRSRLPGCEGCVRITAGPAAHTGRAIELFEEWYALGNR